MAVSEYFEWRSYNLSSFMAYFVPELFVILTFDIVIYASLHKFKYELSMLHLPFLSYPQWQTRRTENMSIC